MDRRDFRAASASAAAGILFSGLFSESALAGASSHRAKPVPGLPSVSINDATLHFFNRISWGVLPADYQHAVSIAFRPIWMSN